MCFHDFNAEGAKGAEGFFGGAEGDSSNPRAEFTVNLNGCTNEVVGAFVEGCLFHGSATFAHFAFNVPGRIATFPYVPRGGCRIGMANLTTSDVLS